MDTINVFLKENIAMRVIASVAAGKYLGIITYCNMSIQKKSFEEVRTTV